MATKKATSKPQAQPTVKKKFRWYYLIYFFAGPMVRIMLAPIIPLFSEPIIEDLVNITSIIALILFFFHKEKVT